MAEFIKSSLLYRHTMATEEKTYDILTNPISHLVLTIEGLNVTDEATPAEILAFINRIAITHKGVGIQNYTSEQLALINLYFFGNAGLMVNPVATDNAYRSYSWIIPFGKKMYDPAQCFPRTTKGEFQITLDTTIPTASLDGALISIGVVELPDATPTNFLKMTSQNVSAPGSTGQHDTDLPRGNPYMALLFNQTTFPAATSFNYTVNEVRLMFDNKELNFASAKMADLLAEMTNRISGTVRSTAAQGLVLPANGAWMDFDPMRDGEYMVDSGASNELKFRGIYAIDEAIELMPVEIVASSTITG